MYHTYKSVQFDSKDGIWIAVVAYLSSFLEMTHFELTRWRQADERNETAREKSIDKTYVISLWK